MISKVKLEKLALENSIVFELLGSGEESDNQIGQNKKVLPFLLLSLKIG